MPVRIDAKVSTDVGTIFLSSERSDGAVLKYGQVCVTVGDTALVVDIGELTRALEAVRSGTSKLSIYNRQGDLFGND